MKYILSLLLILNTCAYADEIFPSGCTAIVVKDESLVLSAPKPLLVMVHNISNMDLWITHPVSDPAASAGWSSRLQADNWSALAVNDKLFELSCIESKPGHEQQVPCAGVVAVCAWSDVKMLENKNGTYWAGEDMALEALKAYIGRRGFVLPSSSQ